MLIGTAHNSTCNERRDVNRTMGSLRQRRCDLLFNRKTSGVAYHDFRRSPEFGYFICHIDQLVAILFFRRFKFLAILSPDENCEDLFWVWLFEIYEGRPAARRDSVPYARHLAEDRSLFATVTFCLRSFKYFPRLLISLGLTSCHANHHSF